MSEVKYAVRVRDAPVGRRDVETLGRWVRAATYPRDLEDTIERLSSLDHPLASRALAIDAAAYVLSRGIVLGTPPARPLIDDVITAWDENGMRKLVRREAAVNKTVCWRPTQDPETLKALTQYFLLMHRRMSGEGYEALSPRKRGKVGEAATLLSAHYTEKAMPYAFLQDARNFLRDLQRTVPALKGNRAAAEIIAGLPEVVTASDAKRYARILKNPEGELTFTTLHPVKFALFPLDPEEKGTSTRNWESFTLALVPESATLSRRLQKARFSRGSKENTLPGALAYAEYSVFADARVGTTRELQSDHDTRTNRCFGVPDWPDKVRAALHTDYETLGVLYSVVPKLHVMTDTLSADYQTPGEIAKHARVYGTDDTPPKGYSAFQKNTLPPGSRMSTINENPREYWLKKLK